MPEFRGLQIEVRCVRCGKLPTADNVFLEMQNHLYICNSCRLQAEEQGKHIAWVSNTQTTSATVSPTATPPEAVAGNTRSLSRSLPGNGSTQTRPLTSKLPADSIFVLLNMPITTSIAELKNAIKLKIRPLMNDPDQKEFVIRLREWQERLQDEENFKEYVDSLKSAPREGSSLSVGGRLASTAEGFLTACETTAAGWADGERYLRSGQLRQWILFQLGDRNRAIQVHAYQKWLNVPDFRALNLTLYYLVPERPFQFYTKEQWQDPNTMPAAKTPEELAILCDIHWQLAEKHLYTGAMLHWLEHSRGIKGVGDYYKASVQGYANQGADRGVGLELMLEQALPNLVKPQLEVSFDGYVGSYTIKNWDRELPHRPIAINIINTTRGFTSLQMNLHPQTGLADWSYLNCTPTQFFQGRPGQDMPINKTLSLIHVEQLRRGRTYQKTLQISLRGEYGQPPTVYTFPVTLKTMHFFQGLRGILWGWGLRGNIPGLLWNGALGMVFVFLSTQLLIKFIPGKYLHWSPQHINAISFPTIVDATTAGMIQALYSSGNTFTLTSGAMLGFIGFWIGINKGHTDYPQGRNARSFRVASYWLLLLAVGLQLWHGYGWQSIIDALTHKNIYFLLLAIKYGVGDLLLGAGFLIIIWIIAFIHSGREKFLRKRYQHLLHPEGRA